MLIATVVAAGDRFIVRTLSPADTIGGGIILGTEVRRLKKSSPGLMNRLERSREHAIGGNFFLSECYAGPRAIVRKEDLARLSQKSLKSQSSELADAVASNELIKLEDTRWIVKERIDEVALFMKKMLARYHRQHKNAIGMKPSYVVELLGLSSSAYAEFSNLIKDDGDIVERHGHLALKSFKPQISPREATLREQALQQITAAGINGVAKGNLSKDLGASPSELKTVLKLLFNEGAILIVDSWVLSSEIVEDCRNKLYQLFESHKEVELQQFRGATNASRNVAVAVLEHFDSQGMTRRQGQGRILLWKDKK